jgi:uncharacterized damage-inducible protein DinB
VIDVPAALPAPAGTAAERTALEGFLEQYRAIVVRKAAAVSDDRARRRLVDSETTVIGLVRHLIWVERAWFGEVLSGDPRPEWRDRDPDWQFRVGGETLEELITEYQAVCEQSRQVAAGLSLDATGQHPRMGTMSLRWIYLHMLEELARHAGHLDILVEQLGGGAGFD